MVTIHGFRLSLNSRILCSLDINHPRSQGFLPSHHGLGGKEALSEGKAPWSRGLNIHKYIILQSIYKNLTVFSENIFFISFVLFHFI